MGMLAKILCFPVTAPLDSVLWVAEQLTEQAERELYSPERVRRQLAELELMLDMGQIGEAEYEAAEEELLDRLRQIRDRQRS
jgi:hypothetical protein